MDYLTLGFSWVIPTMIFIVFIHAHIKGVKIFEEFVDGAAEGFMIAIKLIPYLVGIYVAVGIFKESGAIDLMAKILHPFIAIFKVPSDAFFMSIVRSFSGPAALGMTMDIFNSHGPDSFIGRLTSVLMGSTDTTFYIAAVYFGSVGIRDTRYAVPVGLFADFISFVASAYITRKMFL